MLTVRSTINIASQTVPPIIPVVQGDTGRAILFTLADFTIPAGATATYYVQKPSGEAVYNNATIDGNNVLVELTAQSIIEKGDNYGQVRITVGEEVVTSSDFILLVKEFRGIDAVQSLTEMNIFDKAVEQASEAIDEVKTDALEAIDDAKDEAIEEVTSNFDLKLDASSTKGVQNQVITQAINTVNNAIGDLSGETVTPTATNNYGVGGNVGHVIETWATTEYWHGIYTVSAGNTYGITTVSDFPQQLVVWFTNASNTIIENHKAFATDHVEMVCTAPTGATKLFVMSYGYDAYHGTVQKIEPLSETVSNLKEDYTTIIDSAYVTDTATGAIASFSDGADNVPVKSLTVDIEPVQSGSGDPSPDNVRPISGHTQAVVTRTGKNLLAKPFVYFSSASATLADCFFIKTGQYIFHFDSASATSWRFGIRLMDKNGNFLSDSSHNPVSGLFYNGSANIWLNGADVSIKEIPINIVEDCYIRIVFANGNTSSSTTVTGAQLEVGSTASTFEPYNGQTYTIDLDGTIYGGTLDVGTGVLTVDMAMVTLDVSDVVSTGSDRMPFSTTLPQNAKITTDTHALSGMVCNQLIEITQASTWGINGTFSRITGDSRRTYFKINDDVTTIESLNEQLVLHPLQFAYPIAEPFTVQLTANDIKTLLGQNNVFSDAGNVDATYRADTKLYIQKVLNA